MVTFKAKRSDDEPQLPSVVYETSTMMTRSKRRRIEEHSIASLASIVQILADSGCVGASEIGLLCQTSKQLYRATREDAVWASLCHQKWPCTKNLPKSFLESKGHLWLYKQWNAGLQPRIPDHPIAPPSCTADDITLFVHVMYKGAPLVSLPVSGETLEPLLEIGETDIELNDPAIVGEAEWYLIDEEAETTRYEEEGRTRGLPVSSFDFDTTDLNVRVHCFRSTDSSMCCVFQSNGPPDDWNDSVFVHPLVKEGEAITQTTKYDLSKTQTPGYLWFPGTYDGLLLRNSEQAVEIMNRLRDPVHFELQAALSVTEGGHFAISGIKIKAEKVIGDAFLCGDIFTFDSSEEVKRHGVTLLHILSELRATDFEPERFSM